MRTAVRYSTSCIISGTCRNMYRKYRYCKYKYMYRYSS